MKNKTMKKELVKNTTILEELLKSWFNSPKEYRCIDNHHLMIEHTSVQLNRLIENYGSICKLVFLYHMQGFVADKTINNVNDKQFVEEIITFSTVVVCAIAQLPLSSTTCCSRVLISDENK